MHNVKDNNTQQYTVVLHSTQQRTLVHSNAFLPAIQIQRSRLAQNLRGTCAKLARTNWPDHFWKGDTWAGPRSGAKSCVKSMCVRLSHLLLSRTYRSIPNNPQENLQKNDRPASLPKVTLRGLYVDSTWRHPGHEHIRALRDRTLVHSSTHGYKAQSSTLQQTLAHNSTQK